MALTFYDVRPKLNAIARFNVLCIDAVIISQKRNSAFEKDHKLTC